MTLAVPHPDDARTRRNVIVLVFAQALVGAQLPMIFTIAGLAGQALAANPCLATLPISMVVLGNMLAANPMSWAMQRWGRRTGFWIGSAGGITGAGIGAAGLYSGSFGLFLLGSLLTGVYQSAQGFFRFAATDTASEAYQPRAISYVMAGGLFSAVLGPQLIKLTSHALPVEFLGAYLAIGALNVLGVFLFFLVDIPRPPPAAHGTPRGRSLREMLRTPRIAVAIIVATISYALMNGTMTAAPLAVVGTGFELGHAADIVSAHVVAMFLPSFFTGWFISRFGVERIMATGLAILAGSALVGLAGVELHHFFGALILLGIGWNFGFIGATAMLAAAHRPEERGRIQGVNDMLVFGGVTIASLASGGLMNCIGGSPHEGWIAVNLAMVPLLAIAAGAMVWLWLQARKSA